MKLRPTLPHNAEAELSVVGAALVAPEKKLPAWLDLDMRDFHDPRCAAVWEAMQQVVRRGVHLDEVTLKAELERVGKFEAIGGMAFLGQAVLKVPTAAAADHYAEIIRRDHVTRQVLLTAAGARVTWEKGFHEGDDLRDELVGELNRIGAGKRRTDVITLGEVLRQLQAGIGSRADELSFIRTGLACLDEETGGLPIGVLTVLGARPSSGKTALSLWFARGVVVANPGKHVVLLLFEDKAIRMAVRVLADLADVDGLKISKRDFSDALDYAGAKGAVIPDAYDRIHVVDCRGKTFAAALRATRAIAYQHPVALVAVDYAQKIQGLPGRNKHESISQYVADFEGLIAELGNAAGMMNSQVGRAVAKEDRPPDLEDFKESGSLEDGAKLALFLWDREAQPIANPRSTRVDLLIRKQSEGRKESACPLNWDRTRQRFRPMDIAEAEALHANG